MYANHDTTADTFIPYESGQVVRDTREQLESDYEVDVSRGTMTWRNLPPLPPPMDQGHPSVAPPSNLHISAIETDAQRAGPIGTAPAIPSAQGPWATHAVYQSGSGRSTDRAQSVGVIPTAQGQQQAPRSFPCPLGCSGVFSRQFDAERHARTARTHSAHAVSNETGPTVEPKIVCDQCDKPFAR